MSKRTVDEIVAGLSNKVHLGGSLYVHLFEVRNGKLVTIMEDDGMPSKRKREWISGAWND